MFVIEKQCDASKCEKEILAPAFSAEFVFCSYLCARDSGYYTLQDGLTGGAVVGEIKKKTTSDAKEAQNLQ